MSSEPHAFKPGLTWRSLLALITAVLIVVPASIYLSMVSGGTLALASAFIIAIIFSEVARMFAAPLTKQELFITYEAASVVAAASAGTISVFWIIFRLFYATNPMSWAFKIDGTPIPLRIPPWLAPPPPPIGRSTAYYARTLFHPDLFLPEVVFLTFTGLFLVAEIAMLMMMSYAFVEVERLPFPISRIDASLVETLSERDPELVRSFTLSIYPGAVYGILLIALPLLAGIRFIPMPWYDLTFLTEPYIPGALIGVATDLTPWIFGLLVPLNAGVGMLLGSVATWVFGNYLFLTQFRDVFPEWVAEYRSGLGLALLWQRSFFRVWFAPQIGFTLGLAAVAFFRFRRGIIRAFKALIEAARIPPEKRLYPPITVLLAMYLTGTVTSALLHWYLTATTGVPFPLWISLAYSVGLSLVLGVAMTTAMGETGFTITLPYVWHTIVYFSGYNDYPGWVIAPVLAGTAAPYWTNMVKAAYLTETRPIDLVKAIVIALVLTQAVGIISLDFYWRVAPIPSSAYPFVLIDWARIAIGDSLLITRAIRIDPGVLAASAAIGAGIVGAFDYLHSALGVPLSGPGFVVGTTTLPPYAIAIFTGSLIGDVVAPRVFGRERWSRIRGAVAAGVLMGYGIVIGFTIAAAFIMKAGWIWPW